MNKSKDFLTIGIIVAILGVCLISVSASLGEYGETFLYLGAGFICFATGIMLALLRNELALRKLKELNG